MVRDGCPVCWGFVLVGLLVVGRGWALTELPTPVAAVAVVREVVAEQVQLSGGAVPYRQALLSPEVDGVVATVAVELGERVVAGQTLLTLDPSIAQIEVRTARARVAEAEALHAEAQRRRDELQRLSAQQHVAHTTLAAAEAEAAAAAAVALRERAELERYVERLAQHRLQAPFAGMVVARQAELGQWAESGSTQLELVATEVIRVIAPLPQHYYPRVVEGASVTLRFDALPGERFQGRISARLARGQEASRSFPLLIDLPNPDQLLAPGMSAQITIDLADGERSRLLLPRDAVLTHDDGSRLVWRVVEVAAGSQVEPVTVAVGGAYGSHLELVAGELAEGDQVVVLGNEGLRAGQAVRLLPALAAPSP